MIIRMIIIFTLPALLSKIQWIKPSQHLHLARLWAISGIYIWLPDMAQERPIYGVLHLPRYGPDMGPYLTHIWPISG